MKKKVLLAMSGGTDSSVAAMLLLEEGYEVAGVTFRTFDDDDDEPDFIKMARELSASLGIKHYVLDIRDFFKKKVISYFADEYLAGRTPHPCVKCNNLIKWPVLIEHADSIGFEYIATGHYACIDKVDGKFHISRGVDKEKEQSFFLWGLPQSIISRIVLPLGKLHKTEVRAIAASKGYKKVAERKDSMGICFVSRNYRPFLRNLLKEGNRLPEKGNFITSDGKKIGEHEGYPFYTIGQRRGLGVNLNQPLYVTEIIPNENEIVLGSRDELLTDTLRLSGFNLVSPENIESEEVIVCIRYRKQATIGRVKIVDENRLEVKLSEKIVKESSGQTATFYKDNRVVGGGWIV
jgi:tRNA-specific 2-thiouridylase